MAHTSGSLNFVRSMIFSKSSPPSASSRTKQNLFFIFTELCSRILLFTSPTPNLTSTPNLTPTPTPTPTPHTPTPTTHTPPSHSS